VRSLLFLAHRIPYPPNKGDKIRSFHILRHLSRSHRVILGCFYDDPEDVRHVPALSEWCAEVKALPLRPSRARLLSLRGLLSGEPLTLPYYHDRAMAGWVRARLDSGIDRVVIFSAAMAQYLSPRDHDNCHVVVDFVDVDSDKWRQYAPGCRFPMSYLYQREAERLLAFERQLAARSDAAVFVSEEEAALFRRLAPETAERVHAVDNGVDTDYFSPARDYPNPYAAGERHLVFTGAMDYRANVDAVCWFADEVLPRIAERVPEAKFTIVGARPAPAVQRLARNPAIIVTGTVPDVRPYQAHAAAAVAPLRIARGVQNKVLEAMAMGLPVVATPQAIDGLRGSDEVEWRVSDDPAGLAALAVEVMNDSTLAQRLGESGRRHVLAYYGWDSHMARFERLLEGGVAIVSGQRSMA
jgi:sugar transferase (PEP-CTERM/EpsH1 system associated)